MERERKRRGEMGEERGGEVKEKKKGRKGEERMGGK